MRMKKNLMGVITGAQLARILGCHYNTILNWKETGKIRPIRRLGHSDIYDASIVEKLKKERKQKPK